MVTVEVVESSELNEAMNHIFPLPDDGKSTGEKLLQSMEKIGALEESLNEEAKKQARFRQLMDFYKKQPMQVDMIMTKDWLEKTYGHLVPPNSTAPELATPPQMQNLVLCTTDVPIPIAVFGLPARLMG